LSKRCICKCPTPHPGPLPSWRGERVAEGRVRGGRVAVAPSAVVVTKPMYSFEKTLMGMCKTPGRIQTWHRSSGNIRVTDGFPEFQPGPSSGGRCAAANVCLGSGCSPDHPLGVRVVRLARVSIALGSYLRQPRRELL